jgi:Alkylmercury lyase
MNAFERQVRFSVYASFRERSTPPSVADVADTLGVPPAAVSSALRNLADERCIVLVPADSIWMAHPFSGIKTDFVVTIGQQQWFANCAWDGLSILALFGDGSLDTHSPATGEPMRFEVYNRMVHGAGVVHFLVPPRRFWDDIAYA